MASPAFEAGRPGEAAIEVMRLLERALRDSRAVDLEALCVLVGQKVAPRAWGRMLHETCTVGIAGMMPRHRFVPPPVCT